MREINPGLRVGGRRDQLAGKIQERYGVANWSGTSMALQYHLHQFDGGSALLGAAWLQNLDKVMYATDGTAVSFRHLMNAFARRVGRPSP